MKKQFLIFGIIAFLSIVLVSAVIISHYGTVQTDLEIIQPISVEGNLINDLSLMAGTGIFGDKFTITNIADWDIDVQIVSDNNQTEISMFYCYSEDLYECMDNMINGNDLTITLNNESIDIYSHYFANPLLESETFMITTSVNPIA